MLSKGVKTYSPSALPATPRSRPKSAEPQQNRFMVEVVDEIAKPERQPPVWSDFQRQVNRVAALASALFISHPSIKVSQGKNCGETTRREDPLLVGGATGWGHPHPPYSHPPPAPAPQHTALWPAVPCRTDPRLVASWLRVARAMSMWPRARTRG